MFGKMYRPGIMNFGRIWIHVGLLIFILSTTHGMKCEFCNKEFTCLPRHTWRCRAKMTSSEPPVGSPAQPVDKHSDRSAENTRMFTSNFSDIRKESSDEIVYMSCSICGKKCKGRKGLVIHQRTCKIHTALLGECNNLFTGMKERVQLRNYQMSLQLMHQLTIRMYSLASSFQKQHQSGKRLTSISNCSSIHPNR